ncbi:MULTISPECIES: molecular chaperone [Rahnella]|uniref:Molecular chaperone n=1 Tax=Rahnella laticis TaxID=2787622 RepID=A0ABS0E8K0_9GAMM|nr:MULTISPECIES: molecular chaperone [Rahnella]MBF7981186.1 molecular chaperone [Rahnella laticis]MBF8001051.1 molecular chaperone [Rahnella sp. LAC-M12]
MKPALKLVLFMAALSAAQPSFASPDKPSGFSLNEFRIVYPAAQKKGITWSMTNNTGRAYLMQSWIRPVDFATGLPAAEIDNKAPGDAIPMMVTPPLQRIDSGEPLQLRIRLTGMTLPQDRESVFYLSVKGIPSVPGRASQTGGQLVLAVVNNMKLFYRPAGLPEAGVKSAAKQLRFSLQNEVLVVDNPTPFYLNFSQLTVGGKPLAADELRRLVPPKGQQRYPVSAGMRGAVEWQLVDEDSQVTPLQRQTL